jgi:hypothetical protein
MKQIHIIKLKDKLISKSNRRHFMHISEIIPQVLMDIAIRYGEAHK